MVIELTQGQITEIDDADWPLVKLYTWHALKTKSGWYAAAHYGIGFKRRKMILLHRLIMGIHLTSRPLIDHRDTNSLNNRRFNLRLCSNAQNVAHQRKRAINTSGFKGVTLNKRTGKWLAYIRSNYIRRHLGTFDSPIDAGKAYDRAALLEFGEFAITNF